jgi:hypothetical protein
MDSREMWWRISREVIAIAGKLAPRASRQWLKWVLPEGRLAHTKIAAPKFSSG